MEKKCCFTGHRPQKMPWGYNEKNDKCVQYKNLIEKTILDLYQQGYKYFISGVAQGFDTYCAEIVLKIKKLHPEVKLECALPCKNQEKMWSPVSQQRYHNILNSADKTTLISEEYTPYCMSQRNRYMVDNSETVIAGFDCIEGGTANTINYANKKGKQVITLWL